MAFTKIVSPGIDTTGSYTVQELNTVGVMTAGTVQVGAATTVHTTGIDLGSGNITSHNINSTGIITATSFVGPVTGNITGDITATSGTFSGNVSIGGTLTYEDVTNIDSVGIITARSGIHVTDGKVGIGTNIITDNSVFVELVADSSQVPRLQFDNKPVVGTNNGEIGGILFRNNTDSVGYILCKRESAADDGYIQFGTQATGGGVTERLRIKSDGKLMTQSAGYVYTASSAGSLSLYGGNTNLGGGIVLSGGNDNADIRFLAQASTATPAERMRITSDGKVGIRTDNPKQIFSVVGRGNFDNNGDYYGAWIDGDSSGTSSFNVGVWHNVGGRMRNDGSHLVLETKNTSHNLQLQPSGGQIGVGVASPQQKLDVVGSAHTVAVFRPDTNTVSAYGDASVVNNLVNLRMPYGSNPGSANNNGARWGIKFQGRNDGAEYGTDSSKSASIYAVSEDATAGYNRQVGLAFYTSGFDANQTEKLRITSDGDLEPSRHIKLTKSSDPRIYANTNVGLNIDGMALYLNRYVNSSVVTNLGGGSFGIGVVPATGDGGNSNYNNWDIPKLHVRGPSSSGKFHLLGRFHGGNDADSTGAQIVIHHENDRGMALQGGRSSGNRSYGAIKSLDNLARESNVMVFTGGDGQGVENIKFYTNGGSTGTNERMSINTHGTVHTGGSTEITQTTLKPDLITQAGVVSPMFYRPFTSMSGAPSTSGPGYVDFGTGGVRHNLTDPHLGASYGGAQFQGGLIGSYGQTFSNTASGTTREAMNWNRFRILFRGLCLSTGHTPPSVKFRYSTYHYSNGWTDHSGTEWSFNGTEQARGGRWVVGPWINPSSYFTSWADVPGFALYYNDNSSGKSFRIAGGVYFQFAHFIS